MISINLLPAEFRRRERTPARLFLGALVVVALATSSIAYAAYVRFGLLTRVRAERGTLQEELDGLRPQVAYHDALVSEKRDVERRVAEIREISATRIPWTKKLDQLAETVNAAGDAGRYLVWFDELSIEQQTEARGGGGVVAAKGVSGSDNFANVASFFQDLESPEFFADFESANHPTGKRSEPDPNLVPPQVWEFPVRLQLKKKAEPPKPAPARGAPAAAKPGGKSG